jgi:DnaJ-class molecular chaperone
MVSEPVPVCLRYGIYAMGLNGNIIDRRECSVCDGDRCPYEMSTPQTGVCPQCFGTGLTPVSASRDMLDGEDSVCVRCEGAGLLH